MQPLKKKTLSISPKLYRSYYPHQSRELVSPVCGIFFHWFEQQMPEAPPSAHIRPELPLLSHGRV